MDNNPQSAFKVLTNNITTNMENTSNESLMTFLTNMQQQIRKDIKESNDNLKGEIYKGMNKLNTEIAAVNKKIDNLKIDGDAVKKQVGDNHEEAKMRFARMETRMDAFDKEREKQDLQKRKRNVIVGQKTSDPAGGKIATTQSEVESGRKYSDIAGGNRSEAIQPEIEKVEEIQFRSSWAKQMSQVSLEQQLVKATEAAAKMEREGETKKFTTKKEGGKPILLGDSLDRHNPEDWPWETNEEEWDGTQDRQERNVEKKRRQKMNKERKIEKAARVGRCTLGLGPIKTQSIDYFHTITGDYDEAKKMAGIEYLTEYLQFDHADLAEIEITDTKISQKNDDILYVVFANQDIVKNVRRRVADCQNSAIKTRDYIPPQFFDRYTALAKYASEIRANDKTSQDPDKIYRS